MRRSTPVFAPYPTKSLSISRLTSQPARLVCRELKLGAHALVGLAPNRQEPNWRSLADQAIIEPTMSASKHDLRQIEHRRCVCALSLEDTNKITRWGFRLFWLQLPLSSRRLPLSSLRHRRLVC